MRSLKSKIILMNVVISIVIALSVGIIGIFHLSNNNKKQINEY